MLGLVATREQLRAFRDRPWARLRELKDRHTATMIDREGADAAFRLAAILSEHARTMGAVPGAAARSADLAAAVELRRKLDRASRRYPRPR